MWLKSRVGREEKKERERCEPERERETRVPVLLSLRFSNSKETNTGLLFHRSVDILCWAGEKEKKKGAVNQDPQRDDQRTTDQTEHGTESTSSRVTECDPLQPGPVESVTAPGQYVRHVSTLCYDFVA